VSLGNASAFERTFRPHLGAALNLARWLVRDPADAEDVLQEAYVRAFRHFDSFRGPTPRAWLLAIVRNACWSFLQRKPPAPVELDDERDGAAVVPLQRAGGMGPDDELIRGELGRKINAEVAALRPEFREVFVLRELEGLSYKEIADVAGVPIGTVMSRLSRARADLQERLASVAGKAGAR
jgi:RNA polymerase sigma-70 factor (ECF subfamily)